MELALFVASLFALMGAGLVAATRYDAAPIRATDQPTLIMIGMLLMLLGGLVFAGQWVKENLQPR